MSKKDSPQSQATTDRFAPERRRFLQDSALLGAGAVSLLAEFGVSQYAVAQNAPPAGGQGGPAGAFKAPPPEPKVAQSAPLNRLQGKVAYITASSDGIGLGIARAASNAGMKVCIGYRNEERLAAALALFKKDNAGVFPIKHDVTDRDGWVKVLEQIKSKYGKLHLLVNNAGIKTWAKVSAVSPADWDNAVAVNYTAIYNSVAVCLPHMLEHGEGSHIMCTSSMSGLLPGGPLGVYTATKIAAVGLMEALRVELEGTTVGTSAFCPGGVNTDNYFATGEENPYRAAQLAKAAVSAGAGAPAQPRLPPAGMDPLEAGERVLNGVINNDLFIVTHPEYMPGTQQRFAAVLVSEPVENTPPPQDRVKIETRVLHAGIYAREVAHRKRKRKSFRSVTV
ncbi:MAG: short-chain dehydrogenase/reductase [Gammaproteobacteria bacterium]|jgi:NAD(P)-dependent dehydrogenase (short-subunit alcohol dehydrogenase family)|nr:short-chain dehydrogenase/reductase [Gammaproteobacteria bacterium]